MSSFSPGQAQSVIRIHHCRLHGYDITISEQIQAFFAGVIHTLSCINWPAVENPSFQIPKPQMGVWKTCAQAHPFFDPHCENQRAAVVNRQIRLTSGPFSIPASTRAKYVVEGRSGDFGIKKTALFSSESFSGELI